jgi:hypothetical protein
MSAHMWALLYCTSLVVVSEIDKFGHGLSYSEFELSWSAAIEDASGAPPTMTISLDAADFALAFQTQSFTVHVHNTGKLFGRETVLAFWVPPTSVVEQLKQQLFDFSNYWLEPGASESVSVRLPAPVGLASVNEFGDRILHPGSYTVQFSRGHGAVLNGTLVLTGSGPKLLRSWPRQWGVGSQVALDWCTEQGLDVWPHTERSPAKQWRWLPSEEKGDGGSGQLVFMNSDRVELCLTAKPSIGQAVLEACSTMAPMPSQAWSFGSDAAAGGGLSAHDEEGKQWWVGGPALSQPHNFTTLWTKMRVPLQLLAGKGSGATTFQWLAPDADGFVSLQVEDSAPHHHTSSASGDKRLCLTAQSNTVADAP